MRPPRELATLAVTGVIQGVAGRMAEPVAVKAARRSVKRQQHGERCVRRYGMRWRLDLGDGGQRRLYYARSYERATITTVTKNLRPGDVVLDVGANIGAFSLPVAKAGATVIAVEPASDTVERLREHVELNDMAHRVLVHHTALGERDGVMELRSGRFAEDTGMRTLAGTGDVVETVSVQRGDDLGYRPDIVKIDVEGAEMAVLRGMPEVLAHARIVVAEVVPSHQTRAGELASAPVRHLVDLGFTPFHIRNRGLEAWSGKPGNVIFFREPPASSPDQPG